MGSQTDVITMECSRCWGYLGELGVMASGMIARMERDKMDATNNITEKDSRQKSIQLQKFVKKRERKN